MERHTNFMISLLLFFYIVLHIFFDYIVNISVVNTGTCEIVSLVGYFDIHNAETTQSWNFNSSVGEIYGFGTLMSGEISFLFLFFIFAPPLFLSFLFMTLTKSLMALDLLFQVSPFLQSRLLLQPARLLVLPFPVVVHALTVKHVLTMMGYMTAYTVCSSPYSFSRSP
jgi:hypothetical protein